MVTNKKLIEILRENSTARIKIVEKKNSNYAGGGPESNAFKNFDLVEILSNGKVTREMGLFVRMTDKLARLGTLMFGGQDAVGESVEDTLQDLANYSDLALVAWRDTSETDKDAQSEPVLDNDSHLRARLFPPNYYNGDPTHGQGSGRNVTVVQEPDKTKFVAGVSEYAATLDKQTDPSTENARSILSRFLNFGQDRERAA